MTNSLNPERRDDSMRKFSNIFLIIFGQLINFCYALSLLKILLDNLKSIDIPAIFAS